MNINAYLIRLALLIMLIFGGTFTMIYLRTGDVMIDQMIGVCAGIVLLVFSLIWRKSNQQEMKKQ